MLPLGMQSLLKALPALRLESSRQVHHHMERGNILAYLGVKRSNRARANRNTHINEKRFRALRGRKFVAIELPNFEEDKKLRGMAPHELRKALLRRGMNPAKDSGARQWTEAQLTLQSFGTVIDNFVPPAEPLPLLPEVSQVVAGSKAKFTELKDRTKGRWHNYYNGVRLIKKKQGFEKFSTKAFAVEAEKIYTDAFEALIRRDREALLGLITEHAFEKLWPDVSQRTLVWELVAFTAPSEVVTVRAGDFPYKSGNHIAQITVKMHISAKMALYDRFGRLLTGNPEEPKETTEYVIFENHISSLDGCWRLHDKVYPSWVRAKEPVQRPGFVKRLDLLSQDARPSAPKKFELGIEDTLRKEVEKQKEAEAKGTQRRV